jgi:hypothetical protein
MLIFVVSSIENMRDVKRVGKWLRAAGAEVLPWNKIGLVRPGDNMPDRLLNIARDTVADTYAADTVAAD